MANKIHSIPGLRKKTQKSDTSSNSAAKQESALPIPSLSHPTLATHSSLILFLLLFRLVNAFATQTFFQPDEYWQSQEIAHRIVFGYGYTTWEWRSSVVPPVDQSYIQAAWTNLFNGPIRSILHPLLFVPLYYLVKITDLDVTFLLSLAPRLQQACFAIIGDWFTFKLAYRLAGIRAAYFTLFIHLTNIYTLFTTTRTFSNTLEAVVTTVALYYWPFVPLADWDKSHFYHQTSKDNKGNQFRNARNRYNKMLLRSLTLAAFACLLRPTNGILWLILFVDLMIRTVWQVQKDADISKSIQAGQLVISALGVAFVTLTISLGLDTAYDHLVNRPGPMAGFSWPLPSLTPFAFLHRNVIANLSVFYGQNPWHWYLSQGIPVLCTTWLPIVLAGWYSILRKRLNSTFIRISPLTTLSNLTICTVLAYSLLSHKEFRFLQPLLICFSVFGGIHLSTVCGPRLTPDHKPSASKSPVATLLSVYTQLPRWLKIVLATVQPILAVVLLTVHCRGQESLPIQLRSLSPPVSSIAFLMPCHSTPWMSFLHTPIDAWFLECPPPTTNASLSSTTLLTEYLDQSDIFYLDPYEYISTRFFEPKELTDLPQTIPINPNDLGWRHEFPSHIALFDNLLQKTSGQSHHTVGQFFKEKKYRPVLRLFNSWKHEDDRRDGDVVVLSRI